MYQKESSNIQNQAVNDLLDLIQSIHLPKDLALKIASSLQKPFLDIKISLQKQISQMFSYYHYLQDFQFLCSGAAETGTLTVTTYQQFMYLQTILRTSQFRLCHTSYSSVLNEQPIVPDCKKITVIYKRSQRTHAYRAQTSTVTQWAPPPLFRYGRDGKGFPIFAPTNSFISSPSYFSFETNNCFPINRETKVPVKKEEELISSAEERVGTVRTRAIMGISGDFVLVTESNQKTLSVPRINKKTVNGKISAF